MGPLFLFFFLSGVTHVMGAHVTRRKFFCPVSGWRRHTLTPLPKTLNPLPSNPPCMAHPAGTLMPPSTMQALPRSPCCCSPWTLTCPRYCSGCRMQAHESLTSYRTPVPPPLIPMHSRHFILGFPSHHTQVHASAPRHASCAAPCKLCCPMQACAGTGGLQQAQDRGHREHDPMACVDGCHAGQSVITVCIPLGAAADKGHNMPAACRHPLRQACSKGPLSLHTHFSSVLQLQQAYYGFMAAATLGRTFVLPAFQCFCAKNWCVRGWQLKLRSLQGCAECCWHGSGLGLGLELRHRQGGDKEPRLLKGPCCLVFVRMVRKQSL